MRKPESIQERMAQVRKAQAAGTYTRCPRCGENTIKLGDRLCTNALSRQYYRYGQRCSSDLDGQFVLCAVQCAWGSKAGHNL